MRNPLHRAPRGRYEARGLVVATREGSRRLYRVDPDALAGMRSYLDRFWTDALAKAFELFADRFGDWWPKDSHHILDSPAAEAVLEPREGGRWYERSEDGGECDWGRVLEIDRPNRILLAWQL